MLDSSLTAKASSLLTTLLMINFISPIEKIKIKSSIKNQIELCKNRLFGKLVDKMNSGKKNALKSN